MKSDKDKIEILITVPFAENLIDQLRQVSPKVNITVDPAHHPEDIPAEIWERTEVLYTDTVVPAPEQVPSLRWLQFHYTGVDEVLAVPLLRKPALEITNLSGVVAPQMAEYVVMMMLNLAHRLPDLMATQLKMEWPRDRWDRFMPREIRGKTAGIVGYGSIGRETARLLQMFNMKILATKRDIRRPADSGYVIQGLGDPGGDLFTRLYPIQALASMVKECDYVVVCLPLTAQTRNMIGDRILRAMKPGAFLIDVGRGGIIDQGALLQVLQEKRIAGAALDVFAEEPLPQGSPFWKLPNVIITPHISGISASYRKDAVDFFEANLIRYLNDEPLLNRVDLAREY